MAKNAGDQHDVVMPKSGYHNIAVALRKSQSVIRCTPEMRELIDVLDAGDEEQIKGLLMQHDAVGVVG